MTRSMNGAKLLPLTLLLVVLGMLAAGCGVSVDGESSAGESGAASGSSSESSGQGNGSNGNGNGGRKVPPRPAGVIRIDGKAQGSLTESLIDGYEATGADVRFEVSNDSENQAFQRFCSGRVDVVDAARPISPAEYAKCRQNGIRPVQIQVASDAAVLAIKNETNVGVDCLSLEDVQEIFRAGSDVTQWDQVGYGARDAANPENPPMRVAGPDEDSNVFGFFGRFVLGDPEPTSVTIRSDYEAFPNDIGVRHAVVGSRKDLRGANRLAESERQLNDLRAAIGDARRAISDARAEVEKGIQDNRSDEDRARDRARLDDARDNLEELLDDLPAAERTLRQDRAAAARVGEQRGTLGLFRFSYYELFEEQLRPMEVSATDSDDAPNCIFPSQATVTDATFPLARQLLLTVDMNAMQVGELNDFLTYAVENSQRLAQRDALVPLPDEVENTELAWLSGETPPDIVYYPPQQIRQDRAQREDGSESDSGDSSSEADDSSSEDGDGDF